MRIGVDATSVLDELTGVEVHVHTAVAALARGGTEEVVVFVRHRPPAQWDALPDRFSVRALRSTHQAVVTQMSLPAAARRAGVDVLYCPGKPPPAAAPVPVLTMIHDAVAWNRPETMGRGAGLWFRTFYRVAARRGAHVAAPTAAALRDVAAVLGLPDERLHLVGNAVAPWLDVVVPPERPAIADDGPYLLSVCRLEPRKDVTTVLDAWEAVHAAHPELRLLLVGKAGWKVDALVERARRTAGVELLGEVRSSDLPGLYNHAAAFVSASREEGFGLPVLEAMALGAPVVASAIDAHVEVAGTAALTFEPGDAAGCAAAICRVAEDPGLAGNLREVGRVRARAWSATRLGERLRVALRATVDG